MTHGVHPSSLARPDRSDGQVPLDAVPAAVCVCRPDGRIERCNAGAVELWGRAPRMGDDGERFCGAYRLAHPDGRPMPHDESPMATALRTGHPVRDVALVVERPDGTRADVVVSAAPLRGPDGAPEGAVSCLVDVTARARDAAAVATRERDLTDFFENGAVAMHWVGPDGRILRANRAELDLLGYAPDDYVGRHIGEFHLDAPVIADILVRLTAGQVLHDQPARLRHRDGSVRHVLIDSSVYRAGDEFRHTRCFTRDVTAQRAAEAELYRSETRYRALVESAPDAVLVADADGRWSDANPAACALLGYTREELLAMRVADILPDDARPQLAEVRARLAADAPGSAPDVREWRVVRRDGRRVPVEASTTVLPDGRWQAFARDVTERIRLLDAERLARAAAERAAERTARLQALTAALSGALTPREVARVAVDEGVAATGAAAGIVVLRTDPHVEAGVDDGSAELELVSWTGYPESLIAAWRRIPLGAPVPIAEAVRTGAPVATGTRDELTRRYPALDGNVSFEATVSVPLAAEGRTFGALGTSFREARRFGEEELEFLLAIGRLCGQAIRRAWLYDAAEGARREAERARADADAARVAAEDANRAKSEFLATMSHELRTPLNAIAGYVQLLELGIHGPITDAQRDALARIHRSQRHLLGHINEVLDFARVESGAVRYHVGDVALVEIVAAAESLVAPQLRERGIALDTTGVAAACVARADREKVQQILLNILSNAAKFTPSGGRVAVTTGSRAGVVMLRVQDTGIGIPSDRLEHVFEPFVQVGRSLSNPTEGTGLGLAISRDLARGMGGDLTVESEVGTGSTFTLTLAAAGGG